MITNKTKLSLSIVISLATAFGGTVSWAYSTFALKEDLKSMYQLVLDTHDKVVKIEEFLNVKRGDK